MKKKVIKDYQVKRKLPTNKQQRGVQKLAYRRCPTATATATKWHTNVENGMVETCQPVIVSFSEIYSFFVPDEQFSSVTMWWTWSCSLSLALALALFKTFSYLLNQTSEVHETLPVVFLCQWELVYQFSEKFINFYYPLPIIFVVIFSCDLGGLHR